MGEQSTLERQVAAADLTLHLLDGILNYTGSSYANQVNAARFVIRSYRSFVRVETTR